MWLPRCCLYNQALTGIPINIYEGNQLEQTGIFNAFKQTLEALHGRKGRDAAPDSHRVGFGKQAKVFWHLISINIQKRRRRESKRARERGRESKSKREREALYKTVV